MIQETGIYCSAVPLEKSRQIAFLALSTLQTLTISPLPGEDHVICHRSGGSWALMEGVGVGKKKNQRGGKRTRTQELDEESEHLG